MVLNGQVVKHNLIDPLPAYTSIHLGGEIFTRGTGYLNEFHLFYFYFNAFPSWRKDREIDCIKAHQWFSEIYKEQILDSHYSHVYSSGKREKKYDDIYYILKSGVLVYFEVTSGQVRILFKASNLSTCEEIESGLKQFRIKLQKRKPHIHLLALINGGLDTVSLEIKKPKLCIGDNYNDDFLILHDLIRKKLSKKDEKGLVLLHGKPGTGKTSYIRYLITSVKKRVIFLPPNMAACITNPELIATLISYPNSIFVIEDAENIIVNRERNGYSPVSALLNITDGLLSDCLGIQIVCSFNTDISKVDNALMRKGRLIAKYEFKELQADKAQALSNKLGYCSTIKNPMTLTDIYNQAERGFEQVKRAEIGFNAG